MHDLRSVWDCQWKNERLCGAVPGINYCPIEFDFNVTFETAGISNPGWPLVFTVL